MGFVLEFFHSIPNAVKYSICILFILAFLIFIFFSFSPVFGAFPDKNSTVVIENSKSFVTGKFRNSKSNYTNTSSLSDSSDKGSVLMSWISPPRDKIL